MAMSTLRLSLLAMAALLSGCNSNLEPFRHIAYRTDYAFTDQEIRGLRFSVSTDVLVQGETPPGRPGPRRETAILLTEGTSGAVTDVGPNWIKVKFSRGSAGSGVPFLAGNEAGLTPWGTPDDISYDRYYLATAVEGGEGFEKVISIPDRELLIDGNKYKVLMGATAYLVAPKASIQRLIDKRRLRGD